VDIVTFRVLLTNRLIDSQRFQGNIVTDMAVGSFFITQLMG